MNTSLTVLKASLKETYPGELMAKYSDLKPHPVYPYLSYGIYVEIYSYQNKKFVVYGFAERADKLEQFNRSELTDTFEKALEIAEKYITEAKQFLKYKPSFKEYLDRKTGYKFYKEQINKITEELNSWSSYQYLDSSKIKFKKMVLQDYRNKIKNIIQDAMYEYNLIMKTI
jgi:hypothetical protein